MKFDADLFRSIMLKVEELPYGSQSEIEIEGRDPLEVTGHVRLLLDADFIEAWSLTPLNAPEQIFVQRLTFKGHEFINSAKNDTVWQKAKALVIQKSGHLTVQGLTVALTELVKHMMSSQ